jgi:hypothetical protein
MDLNDNQSGRLNHRQRMRLCLDAGLHAMTVAILMGWSAFCAFFSGPPRQDGLWWIPFGIAGATVLVSGWLSYRLVADAIAGRAERLVCGFEDLKAKEASLAGALHEPSRVGVPRLTYRAMPGGKYLLYYAPRSKRLLSLEPLLEPENVHA